MDNRHSFVILAVFMLTDSESSLESKSYTACYGILGLENYLQPSCPGDQKIVVMAVYALAKYKSTGCPQQQIGPIDPSCCQYDVKDCSVFYNSGPYRNYYQTCNGKSLCQIPVSWINIPSYCNSSVYIERTHYMKMDYYCISDQAVDPCTDLTTSDSPTFFWNTGYPAEMTSTSTSCTCSIEMSCDTTVELTAIDLQLEYAGNCHQSFTVTDGSSLSTFDCSNNNDFLPQVIYTSSGHFMKILFVNNLGTTGGKFSIQVKGTNPTGEVSLSCGASALTVSSQNPSSLPTCPVERNTTANLPNTGPSTRTEDSTTLKAMLFDSSTVSPTISTEYFTTSTARTTEDSTTSTARTTEDSTPSTARTTEDSTKPTALTIEDSTQPTAETTTEDSTSTARTTEDSTTSTARTTEDSTKPTALTTEDSTQPTAETTEDSTKHTAETTEDSTASTAQTTKDSTKPTAQSTEDSTKPTTQTNEDSTISTAQTAEVSIALTTKTTEDSIAPTGRITEDSKTPTAQTTEDSTKYTALTTEDSTKRTVQTNENSTTHNAQTTKDSTTQTALTTEDSTKHTAPTTENSTKHIAKTTEDYLASTALTTEDSSITTAQKTEDSTAPITEDFTTLNARTTEDITTTTAQTTEDSTVSPTSLPNVQTEDSTTLAGLSGNSTPLLLSTQDITSESSQNMTLISNVSIENTFDVQSDHSTPPQTSTDLPTVTATEPCCKDSNTTKKDHISSSCSDSVNLYIAIGVLSAVVFIAAVICITCGIRYNRNRGSASMY